MQCAVVVVFVFFDYRVLLSLVMLRVMVRCSLLPCVVGRCCRLLFAAGAVAVVVAC